MRTVAVLSAQALLAALAAGAYADTLLFDAFDGSTLDPTKWYVDDRATGSVAVSGGQLAIGSGETNGGGTVIWSQETFAPGPSQKLIVEVAAVSDSADGFQIALYNPALDGTVVTFKEIFDQPALLLAQTGFGEDRLSTDVSTVDLTTAHVYRIEWSLGLAEFFVDGVLLATHTEQVPAPSLYPMQLMLNMHSNGGPSRTLYVDYVHVQQVAVPEPGVALLAGLSFLSLWRRVRRAKEGTS